jgi:hypothetical protein
MIIEKKLYYAECDNPKCLITTVKFYDYVMLMEELKEREWLITKDNKTYCRICKKEII